MGKKLSKKERDEAVTKGYLEYQDFVTKSYFYDTLEDVLDRKDYATKDYVRDSFEVMDLRMQGYMEETRRHMNVLMEDNRAQTLKLIDAFEGRFLRLERAVFPEEFAA